MRLLQINVTANWGSTGRIAEGIGQQAIVSGWESWIAYGRGVPTSTSNLIRIGNDIDMRLHGLQTRLFDNHGLASKHATNRFINKIREISPDIIHLHNIHGYYINYQILFDFLKDWGGPVVWTLHDCWPFTGHCAYYDYYKCDKWRTGCHNCPQKSNYPASLLFDRSKKNYHQKENAFLGLKNLILVPVSNWLNNELSNSFLSNYPRKTIHNGIDLTAFAPIIGDTKNKKSHKIILGVASIWDKRKGLEEFIKLNENLNDEYKIILVGLSKEQISNLPSRIIGIRRTDSIRDLAKLYSMADIFINPTFEDNYPTTNLEALACGTPVITYNTGGSPESIDEYTGIVVDKGDIMGIKRAIEMIESNKMKFTPELCRNRSLILFNKNQRFKEYIDIYKTFIN